MINLLFSYLLPLLTLGTLLPCPPSITDMPVLVTWYDPALGGINCDTDCGTFADGTPVTPSDYGQVSACIPEWLGAFITIDGLGTFRCRDTGTAIVIAYNEYYQGWVIHVDIMSSEPPAWNYELHNWHLNWWPVPKSEQLELDRYDLYSGCNQPAQTIELQPLSPELFVPTNLLSAKTSKVAQSEITT